MAGFDGTGGALRRDLRRFLLAEVARGSVDPQAGGFARFDAGFSGRLGARGLIGADWPRPLGGLGGSRLDRQIIAEELLAQGAPVRAHWAAERLAGPLLLHLGSLAQQRELLPRIAAGRLSLCLGVAEAGVSPDPAAMLTTAVATPGGWRITGRKFPVADAGEAQRMLLLARTAPASPEDRLAGLSLFLVDLALPGITRRATADAATAEVVLEDVFIAGDRLVGPAGAALPAWLAVADAEAAAPDRWMRDWPLLVGLAEVADDTGEAVLGRLVAGAFALHALAFDLAGRDHPPAQTALLGLLAADQAAALPAMAERLLPAEPPEPLANALLAARSAADRDPWETRALVQWRLSPWPTTFPAGLEPRLANRTSRLLAQPAVPPKSSPADGGFSAALWSSLEAAGTLRAGLPRSAGGLELGLEALLALAHLAGFHAAPVPLAETLLGHHLLALAGLAPPIGPLTLGPVAPPVAPIEAGTAGFAEGRLAGRLARLPWARHATAMVLVLETPDGPRTILAGRPVLLARGTNQAGEPRDDVALADVPVLAAGASGQGVSPAGLECLGALFRTAGMVGALDRIMALTFQQARQKRLDGRMPVAERAIGDALARLAGETLAARAVLATATEAAAQGEAAFEIACARVRVSEAAAVAATLAHRIQGPASLAPDQPLVALTGRLRSWRLEFGAETAWATRVGALARDAAGPAGQGLWPLIADRGRMRSGGNHP